MEKQTIKTAQKFDKKSFTKKDVFRTKNSIMFMLNFLPNQQMPAHNHPGYELYLHVVQGEGTFTINKEKVDVVEDDVIHCGNDEMIEFTNTGSEAVSIYVTMSRLNR
ncbi:cupin domain-containing protein [Virgibacillus alimentarius]|uniref:Quercetin dioxygenase-like cupin family protein n=1 Tax=Virgibacillus alimentarius TaxID=698769 RepID=A0ABS4S9E2_9BACI|nr:MULTISPECIES: cupin domain-containing protein [Virgibacillus]MBP2258123.1 quercetin dioxygenase-like cupin family protein [Virgibacillus alimentarius]HLR69132.1 cupin domain-containing protein [Virgibacillus sp.]